MFFELQNTLLSVQLPNIERLLAITVQESLLFLDSMKIFQFSRALCENENFTHRFTYDFSYKVLIPSYSNGKEVIKYPKIV